MLNLYVTLFTFGSVGYPCPADFNPADHYIYKLSMVPKEEGEYKERVKHICDSFEASKFGQ